MPRYQHDQAGVGSQPFAGFDLPKRNYFWMPGEWIDITAAIDNLAELKVAQYILRHTWSFQEFGLTKRITVGEFIRGRRRSDSSFKPVGAMLQLPIRQRKSSSRRGWLAWEVLSLTGDEQSLGCYRAIAERCDQQLVFEAMSLLKEARREGSIRQSRGALFVGI